MAISSNCNIIMLIIISSLFLPVLGHKKKTKDDDMCPHITNVLCVKDVLLNIANAAKDINDIANKIEQYIHEQKLLVDQDNLDEYINHKMVQIRANLPPSRYHQQFMNVNNIDKSDLIHLIKEEHDALSYLYNSIKNILMLDNLFGDSIDKYFKTILNNLQKNILCNYRNIFHVYSESWLSLDQIDGIRMLKTRKRNAPSFIHNSYSIIVARLLREWTNHIDSFVVNIESKLS